MYNNLEYTSQNNKALLLRLIEWKKRFESSDEIQEEIFTDFISQFIVNFNTHIDDPIRRELIRIAEKTVSKLWHDANFKVVNCSAIDKLIEFISKLGHVEFSIEEIWFGGTTSNSSPTFVRVNSVQFFSLVIILVASANHAHIKLNTKLFSWMNEVYSSSEVFLEVIIEHDERCLTFLLALLEISRNQELPCKFSPTLMFILLLKKIVFDPEVVLDWLQSEIVAIPFFLRFSKEILDHFEEFSNTCRTIDTSTIKKTRLDHSTTESVAAAECTDDICLTVEELHGEKIIERTIRIPKKSHVEAIDTESTSSTNNEAILESFSEFITRLALKLERLDENGLAPFNVQPLVNVLEKLEDVIENSNGEPVV